VPQLAEVIELVAKHGHLLGAEALHLHRKRLIGPDADRIDRRVVERIRLSEQMTAVDLDVVIQTRKHLIAESEALLGEAIIAFPTTSQVAMPAVLLEADDSLFARENMQTVRNSMLGNFLDWCGVAIHNGVDEQGMPTSLLLSATHGHDTAAVSRPFGGSPNSRAVRSTVTGMFSKLISPIQLAGFITALAILPPN
jgi:aspartyl-tRNA(Asn)/glutamyl-tRNA(Gln) amidotransferase subunit A